MHVGGVLGVLSQFAGWGGVDGSYPFYGGGSSETMYPGGWLGLEVGSSRVFGICYYNLVLLSKKTELSFMQTSFAWEGQYWH